MDAAQTFNVVDMVVILFMGIGLFMGYRRGLSGELARLLSAIAAFALALLFYRPLGAWVQANTRLQDRPAQATAFMLAILGALVAMVLLRILLKHVMQVVFEETTDKVGGAFTGLLRAVLTIIILFMMVNTWPHEYLNRQFGEASFFGRLVLEYMPAVREKIEDMPVTGKVKDKLKESKDELTRRIEEELNAAPGASKPAETEEPRRRWFSRRPRQQDETND